MSEYMQFHSSVSNTTGKPLSKTSETLDHGKWMTSPPSQIPNGGSATFSAQGTEESLRGTEGNVVYQAFDGTQFTVNWTIPYSGANSGGLTCNDNGSGACSTTFVTTASPAAFPVKGDSITVDYTIAAASDSESE